MSKDKSGSSLARLGPILFVGGGAALGVIFLYLTLTSERSNKLSEAVKERNNISGRADGTQGEVDFEAIGQMPTLTEYSKLAGARTAQPSDYAGTGYYTVLVKDIPRSRAAKVEEETPDTTDDKPVKPETKPALMAPASVAAARLSGHPGAVVSWQTADYPEGFDAPDDAAYVVYRALADDQGKPEGSWLLVSEMPQKMGSYNDYSLPPGRYVYAVVQATQSDLTEGVAGTERLGSGDAMMRIKVSDTTVSNVIEGATAAETAVGNRWFITGASNKRTEIDVRFQRWFFADLRNKPGIWLRVNLDVKAIPTGARIGEEFKMTGVLTGRARAYASELIVEYYDGNAFVSIDPANVGPADSTVSLAWDSFRRMDTLDVSTGIVFSRYRSGASPAFVFRDADNNDFDVEFGTREYVETPVTTGQ